ncbi:hypothetical protein BD289DRAFT_184044 [Coniella lustricola]|uniref:Integral membrane protein n=1 Tax=Coniella lustricola TaxID=2025994 RepID=A0A2T3AD80_9PEZI|nr:hypothetical protein BD289DRAFT_184044 [Coniella lustricola]
MASTTIVPFASLPSCASLCGPLYDVNGACVPPNVASTTSVVYEECFCSDARLTAFSTTTAGPCDDACTADPSGYNTITSWYQSMCQSVQALAADGTTSTASSASSTSTSSSAKSSSGGGSWLDTHWQWVIFIVVMVVGIAGIWTGAAFWRRHYLRKKDRQYALGKNLAARTGSGQNPYGGNTPTRSGSVRGPTAPGSFMPSTTTYEEKPSRKWGFGGR